MLNDLDLPEQMFRIGDKESEDFTLQMWKNDKDAGQLVIKEVEAKFSDIDGEAIFEGDIYLGTAEEVRANKDIPKTEAKGLGLKDARFRWRAGEVPYVVAAGDANLSSKVERAIEHWQKFTPFKFIKITAADEVKPDGKVVTANGNEYSGFISFENLGGCHSAVGMRGGKQVISLGNDCNVGSAIHEIGHAVGLFHEQSRADRDKFIKINQENIDPRAIGNFLQHIQEADDLGEYDFGSIMHYPATAFGNGKVTILTLKGEPIGQRNGLSKGDVEAVKKMYSTLNWSKATAVSGLIEF